MLIVRAYIQVGLEVGQVPADVFKLAIHEDVHNLETTLIVYAFYLLIEFYRVMASALDMCSAIMNLM